MATAKITLIGMYQYMESKDDDLFHNLTVPSGIDKQKLINTILLNGAEFEVLYPRPAYFKFLIGPWSDKWYRTMDRWQKALAIDYAPLENYDRMEEWDDNGGSTKADTRLSSDTKQGADNKVNTANSESEGTGNTEDKKSAYDASTYSPYQKSDTSSSGTNNSSGVESNIYSDNLAHNEYGNEVESNFNKRTGRAHGNIGVTTSQQMLQSEIDISRFNLYDEIASLFLSEFCIYTY